MKFTFIQLLFTTLLAGFAFANDLSGQELLDKKISANFQNTKLKDALPRIERLANISFVYSSKAIKAQRKVNIKVQNQKLSAFLDELFLPLNIVYKELNGQILLSAGKVKAVGSLEKNAIKPILFTQKPLATITGKVTDIDGEGLIGANVIVKLSR